MRSVDSPGNVERFQDVVERGVGTHEVDLASGKIVDRAKGILMAKGMSEPDAFKRLQKLAMDKRKTLREIAEAVIIASEAEE